MQEDDAVAMPIIITKLTSYLYEDSAFLELAKIVVLESYAVAMLNNLIPSYS
jgi:hypothetical protein